MQKRRLGHVDAPFKRIHIELTNRCDFNCAFCPKDVMTRPRGNMRTDLALRTLSDIHRLGLAEKVTFHVMGEPTMHPDFFPILEHCARLGLPVGLTSNAGGLGRGVGQELLRHELHQIDLSLQTPDAESFALRRAGQLDFDTYLRNILEFFQAYRDRWPDTIFKLRFLNTTFPPKSIERRTGTPIRVINGTAQLRERFGRWAERLHELCGTPAEARQGVQRRIKRLHAWQWNVVEVLPNTFFETYILSDWGHAFSNARVRDAWGGFCFGMRDHFAVLHNGDVTLCCIDFDGKTVVGNLHEQNLEAVLSGEPLGEIMRAFRRFRLAHPYCRQCLGSRSALSWLVKPVAGVAALHLLKPLFYSRSLIAAPERSAFR